MCVFKYIYFLKCIFLTVKFIFVLQKAEKTLKQISIKCFIKIKYNYIKMYHFLTKTIITSMTFVPV